MNSTLLTRGSLLARLHEEPENAEAWGEFVRIYGGHVIGWCLAHGLQDADASDVSQEVLVRGEVGGLPYLVRSWIVGPSLQKRLPGGRAAIAT